MKKFFAVMLSVVLVVAMLATLAACGEKKKEGASSTVNNASNTVSTNVSSDDTTGTSSTDTTSTDVSSEDTSSKDTSSKDTTSSGTTSSGNTSSDNTSSDNTSSDTPSEDETPIEPTDAEKIVGTWKSKVDMTDMMNAGFEEEEFGEYFEVTKFEFDMSIQYKDDGTYAMAADEDSVKAAFKGLRTAFVAGMTAYYEDMIKESGLDMSLDDLLAQELGMSLEELADMAYGDDMAEIVVMSMQLEGKYKVEDGKLHMSQDAAEEVTADAYIVYELDGDSLKFVDEKWNEEESFGLFEDMLPLTFARVK